MISLSYKYLFAGIMMFICCMVLQIFLSGFICFIIQIIVGVIVYFGILIIFKDEFIYLLIDRIKQKVLSIQKR